MDQLFPKCLLAQRYQCWFEVNSFTVMMLTSHGLVICSDPNGAILKMVVILDTWKASNQFKDKLEKVIQIVEFVIFYIPSLVFAGGTYARLNDVPLHTLSTGYACQGNADGRRAQSKFFHVSQFKSFGCWRTQISSFSHCVQVFWVFWFFLSRRRTQIAVKV
jgi:hypothetical protein